MMVRVRKFVAMSIKYNDAGSVIVVRVEIMRRNVSLNNVIIPLLFWLTSQDCMEHLQMFSGPLVQIMTYKTRVALLTHG
jgi:hypothetical protein